MTAAFRHTDVDRTVVFGRGALGQVDDLLPEHYTLLTTPRALATAPAVGHRAAAVVEVPAGLIEDVAAALLGQIGEGPLVALGGGRVIDAAKAVAAATGGRTVAAMPTSLSGAEMTGMHRHARGVVESAPRVRASLVINDPALSASQPVDQLAASSANALAHAIAALTSRRPHPIAAAVAADAVRHLERGWSAEDPDRDTVALGALLAGWAIDHTGLGPHHVLAQTAVRSGGLGHARANAALLPATTAVLRRRSPDALAPLDAALGRPVEALAEALRARAGAAGLGAIGSVEALFERTVDAAMKRHELTHLTPPFARGDVAEIYRAAAMAG
jgi:alcohol dehydrogenase class IV